MTQLQSVTCHMGSYSVTCYPTQVNTPRLNPSHTGRYSIYIPRRDGRLSWPSWHDSAPAGSQTCDLSITSPTLNRSQYFSYSFCPNIHLFRIMNWSHIATHLGVVHFKKVLDCVVSHQIGIKFGRIVLQVNTHRLTESCRFAKTS